MRIKFVFFVFLLLIAMAIETHSQIVYSVYSDTKFNAGFNVRSTTPGVTNYVGTLNYGGIATGIRRWIFDQWSNVNNDIMTATYTRNGSVHDYKVGTHGNYFSVDTSTGRVVLNNNASTEYGLNGVMSNPRKSGEPWPHTLLSQAFSGSSLVKIAGKKYFKMQANYKLLQFTDRMPPFSTKTNLHAAQFQWFITLQNRNVNSPDYGRYIWFGLGLYDNRYNYSPYYAAQDGGKVPNTGAFIFKPDMTPILQSQGVVQVGKAMYVNYDVLPLMRAAFELAQQRNYLIYTSWDDLYIGDSNIGWEVPGTYDVSMELNGFDIYYEIEDTSTELENISTNKFEILRHNNSYKVKGVEKGIVVSVYNSTGRKIAEGISENNCVEFTNLEKGLIIFSSEQYCSKICN